MKRALTHAVLPVLLLLFGSGAALAQDQEGGLVGSVTDDTTDVTRIAIPPMPTQQDVDTPAGSTELLGRKIAEVIAADLSGSGLFAPIGPDGLPLPGIAEVTNPQFDRWTGRNVEALVQGFVRSTGGDAQITVGCYLYDVALRTEQTRQGYVVAPRDWRRAAHRCADLIYSRLTGESPFFDSRIAYIAETGPGPPHQAAGDHGQRRRQPSLHHQRPVDRTDAALVAGLQVDRLCELCRPQCAHLHL